MQRVFVTNNLPEKPCATDGFGALYCPRYKNRGSLAEYLGDSQPLLLEKVAVRVVQTLNGCLSLDWEYENSILILIRETGLGFRLSYFVTNVSVVLSTLYLDVPLLGQHKLDRAGRDFLFGDFAVNVCFFFFCVDAAVLALAYFLIRWEGCHARPGQVGECVPFYRLPMRQLREFRSAPVTSYTWLMRWIFFVYYVCYFLAAVLSLHTVLSHMYVASNGWFALLLLLINVSVVMTALFDLSLIGSPWGVQEASRTASWLVCLRGIVLVPLTVIWSATSVVAAFPPAYCVRC